METKKIDLNDWVRFGEGGSGESYYHKNDDSLMLKLYFDHLPKELAEREYTYSKAVYDMGIPCPAVYDFVTDGQKIGITFERVKEKISFASAIVNNPEKMTDYMKEFARIARILHSTECNTSVFPNQVESLRNLINACPKFDEETLNALNALFDSLGNVTTCLHGDFHIGNAILSGDKSYFIDLGDFAYGNPMLDLAEEMMCLLLIPDDRHELLFHMSKEMHQKAFGAFLMYYYDLHSQEQVAVKFKEISKYVAINVAHMAVQRAKTDYLFIATKKFLGLA